MNFRNGETIKSSSKYSLESSGASHALVIKSASLEDIAAYSCQAENVRMQTELELKGADEKIEVDDSEEAASQRCVDATKGQDVTFTVPFGKSVLKKPDAEWLFQGQKLKDNDRVSLQLLFLLILEANFLSFGQISISTTRNQATITIKQAENQDCGTYTLKLANAVSEISVNFTLSIKGKKRESAINHFLYAKQSTRNTVPACLFCVLYYSTVHSNVNLSVPLTFLHGRLNQSDRPKRGVQCGQMLLLSESSDVISFDIIILLLLFFS